MKPLPQLLREIVPCDVTLRHGDYACRLAVVGLQNAERIITALTQSFVFRTSEPLLASQAPAKCSFAVAYGSQVSHREMEHLLHAIPGVRLINQTPPRD
jgi:hypothetical protein